MEGVHLSLSVFTRQSIFMTGHPRTPKRNRVQILPLLLAYTFCVLAPQIAFAQKNSADIPTISNVVAIQGATIVLSPGNSIEEATVVF